MAKKKTRRSSAHPFSLGSELIHDRHAWPIIFIGFTAALVIMGSSFDNFQIPVTEAAVSRFTGGATCIPVGPFAKGLPLTIEETIQTNSRGEASASAVPRWIVLEGANSVDIVSGDENTDPFVTPEGQIYSANKLGECYLSVSPLSQVYLIIPSDKVPTDYTSAPVQSGPLRTITAAYRTSKPSPVSFNMYDLGSAAAGNAFVVKREAATAPLFASFLVVNTQAASNLRKITVVDRYSTPIPNTVVNLSIDPPIFGKTPISVGTGMTDASGRVYLEMKNFSALWSTKMIRLVASANHQPSAKTVRKAMWASPVYDEMYKSIFVKIPISVTPPTITFTAPDRATAGQRVTFKSTIVSKGAAVESIVWNFGVGSELDRDRYGTKNMTYTFPTNEYGEKTYDVRVTIVNAAGKTASYTKPITITNY